MSDTLSSLVLKRPRNDSVDLIEQVRARPCLWDRAFPTYRNRIAKENAWRDICRALHPAEYDSLSLGDRHEMGVVMMRKWYNIRDAYKKYYTARGTAPSTRPYLYADYLDFLIPIFDGHAKVDPIKLEPVDRDSADTQDQDKVEWLNAFELEQLESSPPKRAKVSRGLKETTDAEDNLLSVLVNFVEKEEDEDRAFFRSITPAVKSLPDDVKFVFRIRVMKLLNNMKKECAKSNNLKVTDESDTE